VFPPVESLRFRGAARLAAAALVGIALALAAGCGGTRFDTGAKRILILGMDGLDPRLVSQWLEEGKLPNLDRLRRQGGFRPLTTSVPPESPVAWSNFITGMNPGGHGIYDFFLLDPATQDAEGIRDSVTVLEGAARDIKLLGWKIPLGGVKMRNARKGDAWWQILERASIPASVMRIPANFPPVETEQRTVSGMGTPELTGAVERYTYYTDNPPLNFHVTGGKIISVYPRHGRVETKLYGPPMAKEGNPESSLDLTVYCDADRSAAKIVVGDATSLVVNVGEWSEWVPVTFEILPHLASVEGQCRFLLKEIRPDFKLYVTSIHYAPDDPAAEIDTGGMAGEEYEGVGRFHTKGLPLEFKALHEGILSVGEFIRQTEYVRDEEFRLFDYELDRFRSGVLFCYFSHTDLAVHCLWNLIDPESPTYDAEAAVKYGDTIEKIYVGADGAVGKALDYVERHPDTLLVVLSDHGMGPFRRAVNLNTWLVREGYLVLQEGKTLGPNAMLFDSVDWSRTRAYAFGFAGIFVNEAGRQKYGVVEPGADKDALVQEIREKLLALRDGDHPVFKSVYRAEEVYSGACVKDAPDLVVGAFRGWRVSDESAQGFLPEEVLFDNPSPWSGDHSMAFDEVPGVLFSNRPIRAETPALYDVTVSILEEYGIEPPAAMVGQGVF